jgi:multidrug resistance efflux pump
LELARADAEQAKAAYEQAWADRDIAKLNLTRSEVRAPANGRVTNVELRPGAYVSVGRGVMALVDSDTLRVEGYFAKRQS